MKVPALEAWDTTIASRLLATADHERVLDDLARGGVVVAITPPTIREISFGAARVGDEALARMQEAIHTSLDLRLLRLLPVTAEAAWLAGQLDVHLQRPPAQRGDKRSKARRDKSFREDILIAATAYAHGYAIRTLNSGDFEAIGAKIHALIMDEPLEIAGGPPPGLAAR